MILSYSSNNHYNAARPGSKDLCSSCLSCHYNLFSSHNLLMSPYIGVLLACTYGIFLLSLTRRFFLCQTSGKSDPSYEIYSSLT